MNLQEKLKALLKKENRTKLLIVAAALGILLLLIADAVPITSGGDTAQKAANAQYAAELEERLKVIISSIDGAGKASVMITLESNGKSIYANSEKSSSDSSIEKNGSQQSSATNEKEVTVIDSGSGDTPILVSELLPEIKGVVIVCKGAADPLVRERIVMTVRTALNISAANVYVTY